jgi:hypothetical protein
MLRRMKKVRRALALIAKWFLSKRVKRTEQKEALILNSCVVS